MNEHERLALLMACAFAVQDGHITSRDGEFYFDGGVLSYYSPCFERLWADAMIEIDGGEVYLTDVGEQALNGWLSRDNDAAA